MKQFRKLSLLLTLAVIFGGLIFSCSDDKINSGGNETGLQEGDDSFFSFTMSIPDAQGTRAAETEKGTDEERVVNCVTILLYEAGKADGTLLYRFDLDATNRGNLNDITTFKGDDVVNDTHATSPEQSRFVSKAREVKYQDYQMVVLVNYNEMGIILARSEVMDPGMLNESLVVGQSTLDQIHDAVYGGEIENYKRVVAGFFMSNANGVIDVKKEQLKETPKDAETTPVMVKVDRLLAKVRLFTDFDSSKYEKKPADDQGGARYINLGTGDVISNIVWGLNSQNNVTYLIRHLADLATSAAGGPGGAETRANSYSQNRKYIYATDPNFDWSDNDDDHFYGDDFPGYEVEDYNGGWEWDYPDYGMYTFENTLSLDAQKKDVTFKYTTHVVIEADYKPTGVNEDSYYSFVNESGDPKIFTHSEYQQWKSDDDFPTSMSGLKAAAVASGLEFDGMESYLYETKGGITFHYMGKNKYIIPIKHFQPTSGMADPQENLYGYYGVVRNNVYNIRIKSITGPGTGDTRFLSADIAVNEWFIRDQEEEEI